MDYSTLAASASTLHERIERGHVPDEWLDGAADDTDSKVVTIRRLLETADAETLADRTRDDWPDDEELPGWVGTFSELLDFRSRYDDPNALSERFDRTFPFEEAFLWILDYAREELVGDLDAEPLSERAERDFAHHLLERLVDVGGQPLHLDFVTYVAERDPDVLREDRRSPDETGWYDEYVAALFDGRADQFFEAYPVVARLITVVVEQWAGLLTEFASRLADDHEALRELTGVDDLGRLATVELGAGDPHDGGRTVVVTTFEDGTRVVYKPRDVEPERRFYGFLDWLAAEFDEFPELSTPAVVARDGYGWMEHVDSHAFADVAAVEDYYVRAGALLCVAYVLDVVDGHHENVIACDPGPVVVDAETVLQTEVPTDEIPRADRDWKLQNHFVGSTVLKSALLPYELEGYDNDMSGFGAIDERDSDLPKLEWVHVNTDAMDVEYSTRTTVPEGNYPTVDGRPARPDHFVEELVAGFETAYDAIAGSRERVADRIEASFGGITVRNVVQSTEQYFRLLETTSNPEYLESGVTYECKIQRELARLWDGSYFASEADRPRRVIDAEKRAILERDVPRFTTRTDEDELSYRGERVDEGVWETTGVDQARSRVEGTCESDKRRQLGLIRACVDARLATEPGDGR